MNAKHRYTISITEDQAQVIADACDLLARVHMGQLEAVRYALEYQIHDTEKMALFDAVLRGASAFIHPFGRSGSYGINSPEIHERARVAFDVYQVIKQRLLSDRGEKNPRGFFPSSRETPATIEPIDGDEDAE